MKKKFRQLLNKPIFQSSICLEKKSIIEEMERMLVNEADMRTTLIDLSSKLQSAGSRLSGTRNIYRKIRYLELQERCETLLEDINRGFGDNEKHINDVSILEKGVNFWLARLENDDV